MSDKYTDYSAYLLRIWIEQDAGSPQGTATRLSLEEVASGKRIGFRSTIEMMAFLEDKTKQKRSNKEQ